MPKPTKGPRLGGNASHEGIILRNLASQLFEHGRITTTETKARRLQPLAERFITKGKRGDLAARREVLKDLTNRGVVATLFEEIAPAMAERDGGYTRITKIGPRKGDNAPMAVIELVTEPVEKKAAPAKATPAAAEAEAPEEAKVDDQAVETAEVETPVEETEAAQEDAEVSEEAKVDDQAVETAEVETPADEAK